MVRPPKNGFTEQETRAQKQGSWSEDSSLFYCDVCEAVYEDETEEVGAGLLVTLGTTAVVLMSLLNPIHLCV